MATFLLVLELAGAPKGGEGGLSSLPYGITVMKFLLHWQDSCAGQEAEPISRMPLSA